MDGNILSGIFSTLIAIGIIVGLAVAGIIWGIGSIFSDDDLIEKFCSADKSKTLAQYEKCIQDMNELEDTK